jgi:hypothetical protein
MLYLVLGKTIPIEPYSVKVGITITQNFEKLPNSNNDAEHAVMTTGRNYREKLSIRLEKKEDDALISSRLLSADGKTIDVKDRENAAAVVTRIEGLSDMSLSHLEQMVLKTMPETKNANIVIELISRDITAMKRRTYVLNENIVDIVYKPAGK